MTERCTLTIVVAVKDATENLREITDRLSATTQPSVQLLFVFAGEPPQAWSAQGVNETLSASADSLVPHLWRDGIRHARGDAVALTTAQCLPAEDWVASLLAADLTQHVGVGGPIDLDQRCSPVHKAIYLLRYIAFALPQRSRTVQDIAADNAVYRRTNIMAHDDLLAQGFWEPSFHRRFAVEGLTLTMNATICVAYRGRETPGAFALQRFQHGREYGSSRSTGQPLWRRLLYLIASPILPFVILTRIVRRASRRALLAQAMLPAAPWLLWFVVSWSLGEARGYLGSIISSARGRT